MRFQPLFLVERRLALLNFAQRVATSVAASLVGSALLHAQWAIVIVAALLVALIGPRLGLLRRP